MDPLLFAFIGIVFALLLVWYWRGRPHHICPHCQQAGGQELDREVTATRYVAEMSTFGGGDGGTHIKNRYNVRYRCRRCGHHWIEQTSD